MNGKVHAIEGERTVVHPPAALVLSSKDFIAGFTPPDYLVEGILQRRFIYSFTAPTGAGKTAIALLMSSHVDQGWSLAGREVERGRVLYFAGENPDDIRMRWIGMAHRMGFDVATANVHFIAGTFSISAIHERVAMEATRLGGLSLIVVDTGPAFFEGKDENDNTQMGAHGRMLRGLTMMPGGPTVLVPGHPVKNATADNLLPRGGGAFVAEMDGNLTCVKDDTVVRLHWQGKFRGPDFEPISFELLEVRPPSLVDTKGRQIPTVVAALLGAREEQQKEDKARSDEEQLMRTLRDNPSASYRKLIAEMGWPEKSTSRVHRVMQRLERERLVKMRRGKWTLTEAGKKETVAAETPA
jgi:hypothetical protein